MDIVKGGYCSTHMTYGTHFQFVYFAYKHSLLGTSIAVDDLKTKAYESKEKTSHTGVSGVLYISFPSIDQYIMRFYSLSLCIMKCFHEVRFILSDFYEPTAQSTSSLRFNCGIKTGTPLYLQERSRYSSCLVHKELAHKLY